MVWRHAEEGGVKQTVVLSVLIVLALHQTVEERQTKGKGSQMYNVITQSSLALHRKICIFTHHFKSRVKVYHKTGFNCVAKNMHSVHITLRFNYCICVKFAHVRICSTQFVNFETALRTLEIVKMRANFEIA